MGTIDSKGKLTVKVSSALGAIPIKDALVFISSYVQNGIENNEMLSLRTDADGLIKSLELPAPAKSLSLSPGDSSLPYSEYVLTVKKDGYKTAELVGIPIFDGITSIQNVNLVPLTEDELLRGVNAEVVYFEDVGYKNLRADTLESEEAT